MKLCMIGIRGHNHYVFNGLAQMPHVRVVGISAGTPEDNILPLAQGCAAQGQQPPVYDDYRDMLDRCQPDIVSICGPFERRTEMAIEAFQRGIHVFSDKTVAITWEQLTALQDAYARAKQRSPKLHIAAMMGLRYAPAFLTAWRAVQAGAIGTVRLINAQKSYRLGERDTYYRNRATYGGTIPWVGSHAIDWIMWFSGQQFTSVYATHSTAHNRGHGDLEVSALCHFTLTDDVFASASIDYLRPATAPTHGDDRVRVVGSEGVIEVQGGTVTLINGDADGVQTIAAESDRQIFRDFVEHIEGKTTMLLSPEDTFAVTATALLARRSADEGRVIAFDGSLTTEITKTHREIYGKC